MLIDGLKQPGKVILFLCVALFLMLLGACNQPSAPKDVAASFWRAVQQKDMEMAKDLSSWNTVGYLKYLNNEKIHPERFELGEQRVGETSAEIDTTLYSSRQGTSGVKIPGKTVLLKTTRGWRVDVKRTLGSVVSHTVDTVFDQLNNMMQQGIKELDKSLSKSINEIGDALQESTDELKKELTKPLLPPSDNHHPVKPDGGTQI